MEEFEVEFVCHFFGKKSRSETGSCILCWRESPPPQKETFFGRGYPFLVGFKGHQQESCHVQSALGGALNNETIPYGI